MVKKADPSSLNPKALLEVLFWTHTTGISEEKIMTSLNLELTDLQILLETWQEELKSDERGFILEKISDQWILNPKKEYSRKIAGQVKQKKAPLDQREIMALLFYEGALSRESINEKRGKSSSGALKKLESEGFLSQIDGIYALTPKCREVFGLNEETT